MHFKFIIGQAHWKRISEQPNENESARLAGFNDIILDYHPSTDRLILLVSPTFRESHPISVIYFYLSLAIHSMITQIKNHALIHVSLNKKYRIILNLYSIIEFQYVSENFVIVVKIFLALKKFGTEHILFSKAAHIQCLKLEKKHSRKKTDFRVSEKFHCHQIRHLILPLC